MLKQRIVKFLPVLLGLALLGPFLFGPKPAIAANPTTINFQGKVVNSNGTNVTNGTYSFVFRIYNTSSPTMTTSCTSTATCLWQETQASVTVTNGVFQVELGSSCALTSASCNNTAGGPINFASNSSLYLTLQFNGDTSGSNGGFMSPLIHITSVPFAFQADNASNLGGLAAGNFVQLAQGLQSVNSSTNPLIYLKQNGGTANILQLQSGSTDVLTLGSNGLLSLQPAASMTAGQTALTQTITNASSTGGTVNGYSQTITVSNTTSASTTNGINISLTDNASSLANINTGLTVNLSGSNGSYIGYGIDSTSGRGIGIRGTSQAFSSSAVCGSVTGISSGVCGVSNGVGTVVGVLGNVSGNSDTFTPSSVGDAGLIGYSSGTAAAGNTYVGAKGISNPTGTAAYTSIGVVGSAKGVSGATVYGGYFTFNPSSSSTAGAALYATNSTVAANILDLQDNTTSVFTVGDGGLITLQPAAALTGTGTQSNVSQSLTNNQTSGTVNGYNQSITVSNASGTTTTNGFNISMTDNTALGNTNVGTLITLQGSNGSQKQIGQDISVNHGTGLRVNSSGSGGNVTCGSTSNIQFGICNVASGTSAIGLYSESSGDGSVLGSGVGSSVYGYQSASGTAGKFYTGVTGSTFQSGTAAYTSAGVYGKANAGAGATIYGGYFSLGTGGATAGAALYATNSGVAANILQLQNNNVNAMVVNSSGNLVLGQSSGGGANGTIVFDNSNNSNTLSLVTGTTAANGGSGLTLTLPTAGASGSGQCLQSGGGSTVSSTNLTFGSCSGSSGGYATIDNAGSPLAAETTLNFTGNSISCADNSGSARTDCTVAPTLQNAYDNSGSPATITTSSSSKGILFAAGASSNSTSFFQLQNSSGSSGTLFNADTTNMRLGVNVTYTAMTTPSGLTSTASAGTGFTAGQSYLYEVTAIDSLGGETGVSNEPTACAPASTNLRCTLAWTAVSGASGYRVYRTANGGASGSEKYLTSVISNSYIDSNAITLSSTNPPSSNTAYTSSNISNSLGQISVGGLGSPTGQVYVGGILPYDVTNGGVTASNLPYGIFIQGHYAYVAQNNGKLRIFDISNPAAPFDVSNGGASTGSNPEYLSVSGHYAYVPDWGSQKLQVFDVSKPSAPVDVSGGGVNTLSSPNRVYVQGRYAFVSESSNFQVFDVSNPANPKNISTGNLTGGSYTTVAGRYAYSISSSTLSTIDLSNPAAPTVVGTASTAVPARDLYVQGRYLYIVGTSVAPGKLQIFDISNPASPVDVSNGGVSLGSSNDVAGIYVQGRYAYITAYTPSKLLVFDVSNPAAPKDISGGGISTNTNPVDIVVQGRYAYVGAYTANKLQVFDLGGEYTQQFEAGGAEIGTLQVDSNAQFAGDSNIQGGLSVGQSLQAGGNIGAAGGLSVQGATILTGGKSLLGPPTSFVASAPSSGGTLALNTPYYYKVTALDAAGNETTPTTEACQAIATSGTLRQIVLTWSAPSGGTATAYNVYRSNGSAGAGCTSSNAEKYLTTVTGTTYTDNGSLTPTTQAPPSTDQTGQLTVIGSALFMNSSNSTTAFQIQDASGTNLLKADTTSDTITIANLTVTGTCTGCAAGGGTALSVNGTSVGSTGNLQNTTGTTSAAATTFTNTSGNITLTVAAAGNGASGIVTATGTQTFDGTKVFTGGVTVQNASGITIGTSSTAGTLALFNGTNTVSIQGAGSTTAYTIVLPAAAATAAGQCLTSTGSNGTLQWLACGAGNTATVTLSPEYAGAVMTHNNNSANGSTGTMTSDFCSGSSHLGIPASSNPCGATQDFNYYSWTEASGTNDYDVWTNWQAPSDFSSISSITFYGWTSSTSDAVKLTVYNAGTACGNSTISAASTSFTSTTVSTSACSGGSAIAAGTNVTFDVDLKAGVANEFARVSNIVIVYNRQ